MPHNRNFVKNLVVEVIKMVNEDVAGKVDTQYIEEQLSHVQNVGILYICTSDGGEEDEWIDQDSGMLRLVIHLPYKKVKLMKDVRPLMLKMAKERLGLISGSSPN